MKLTLVIKSRGLRSLVKEDYLILVCVFFCFLSCKLDREFDWILLFTTWIALFNTKYQKDNLSLGEYLFLVLGYMWKSPVKNKCNKPQVVDFFCVDIFLFYHWKHFSNNSLFWRIPNAVNRFSCYAV